MQSLYPGRVFTLCAPCKGDWIQRGGVGGLSYRQAGSLFPKLIYGLENIIDAPHITYRALTQTQSQKPRRNNSLPPHKEGEKK